MKRLLVLILVSIALAGCGVARYNDWHPEVGMTEQEIIEHWGESRDCPSHLRDGDIVRCWYTIDSWTGLILDHYWSYITTANILVSTENGKVVEVYER